MSAKKANKKKISVSLDESTVLSLMKFLSGSGLRNRSQAIEYAAKSILNQNRPAKVKQSISLDPDILDRINALVSFGQFRSVSHFMEHAVKELVEGGKNA